MDEQVRQGKRARSRWGKWLLRAIVAVLLFVALLWAAVAWSPLVPRIVLPQLARMTGADVTASSVNLTPGGAVTIRGLCLTAPGVGEQTAAEFLEVDRAKIQLSLPQLLRGVVAVERLELDRPVVRVCQSVETGLVNVAALNMPRVAASGGGSTTLPTLVAWDGTLEIGEYDADGYRVLRRMPIAGVFDPIATPDGGGFSFRINESDVNGTPREGTGRSVAVSGRYDANGLDVVLGGMTLDDWPAELAPTRIRSIYERLALAGKIEPTRFHVSPDGEVRARLTLAGVGINLPFDNRGRYAEQGRLARLNDTRGTIEFSGSGVEARLTGLLDDLPYEVELNYMGLAVDSPFVCELRTESRVRSDMELSHFAPEDVNELLELFAGPEADVRAVVSVVRGEQVDGAQAPIEVSGSFALTEADLMYVEFPYRVSDISALITFQGNRLEIRELRGKGPSGGELRATGVVEPIGDDAEVVLNITGERVPIDEYIRGALGDNGRALLDALFSVPRYRELVSDGLVVTPLDRGRRLDELDDARERLRLIERDGGAAELGPARRRVAELERTLAAPVFAFGGEASIGVRLHRARGLRSSWDQQIDVRLDEAGLVPEHFPWPVIAQDVRVSITGDRAEIRGGTYRGLTGGVGRLAARMDLSSGQDFPTVHIEADDVPIDQRLLNAIPGYRSGSGATPGDGMLREALDRLRLEGTVACVADVGPRDDGRLGYDVTATVAGVRARPAGYELGRVKRVRVDDLSGTIRVNESRIAVELAGMAGAVDGGPQARVELATDVSLAGTGWRWEDLVGAEDEPKPRLAASVRADGVDLSLALGDAVATVSELAADQIVELRRHHDPSGVIDISASLRGELGGAVGGELTLDAAERLRLTAGERRVEIGSSTGSVSFSAGPAPAVRFDRFSAALRVDDQAAGMLVADGRLPLDGARGAASTLAARLEGVRFESAFTESFVRDRLGDQLSTIYDTYRPVGVFDIAIQASPAPEDGPRDPNRLLTTPKLAIDGAVVPRSLALAGRDRTVRFDRMDGRVVFSERGGRFERLRALGDGWDMRGTGSWRVGDDGAIDVDASIGLDSAGLADDLVAVLPAEIGTALRGLEVGADGSLGMEDGRLVVRQAATGAPANVTFDGTLGFRNARATVGAVLTDLDGQMGARLWTDPGGRVSYEVSIDVERGRAAGARLTNLRAVLTDGESTSEVLAPIIEADCHGGRVAGSALVRTDEQATRYWLDLRLAGVRAAPLLGDLSDAAHPDEPESWSVDDDRSRGIMDADLSLAGTAGDPDALKGRGEVVVAGGRIVSIPVLLNLIEFSNLRLPVGQRLDVVQAAFYLDGPVLTFEHVSALSDAVELFGYGTMGLPGGELDMRFNSRAVRRVPFLSGLFEGIRDELITTKVGGRIDDVAVSSIQFGGTRRVVSGLLGDDQSGAEARLREIETRARAGLGRILRSAERASQRTSEEAKPGQRVRPSRTGASLILGRAPEGEPGG